MKKILIFGLLLLSLSLSGQITKVNVGTTGGDGTGDNLRAAFTKVNIGIDTINAHTIKIPLKAPKANPTFTGIVGLPSTTSIGNVSSTELGYLDNVTSAIQTQLNAKANASNNYTSFTGATGSTKTYTLPDATTSILTTNAAVTVAQGGTGVVSTTAYGLLAGGTTTTGALQNIGAGTSGQIPVSAGASALPAWTSPVDASSLNLSSYSYVIDTIAGTVYATAKAGSGLSSYTGTVAATVINQAIAALTNGGDIYFKRKNYTITAEIVDGGNSNINLIFEKGAKLTAGDGLTNLINDYSIIHLTNISNWNIIDIEIDGNSTKQALMLNPDAAGIFCENVTNVVIERAYIYNCIEFGVYFAEACISSGVINSYLTTCNWNAITLGNHITANNLFAINNDISHTGDIGISIIGQNCRVTDNYIHDNDGVLGDVSSNWGIAVEDADGVGAGNLIAKNIIVGGAVAIHIAANRVDQIITENKISGITLPTLWGAIAVLSNNCIISNNIIQSTDAEVVGILAQGHNLIIQGNKINTVVGIRVGHVDRNLISNNEISSSSVAIRIGDSDCDYTRIFNNDLDGSASAFDDNGVGTIYSNNILTDGTLQPNALVSITEFNYLDGVTSAIQTQLTSKVAKLVTDTLRVTDATYTLALTDAGKTIRAYRTTWQRITVPLNSSVAFPIGTVITVKQDGAGIVKFLPESGVVFKAPLDSLTMNTRYSWVQLIKQATDKWEFIGRLED
jgi:hypothetical protein